MPEATRAFVDLSRRYLKQEYPSKIRIALARLPEGDLWWRPNPGSNSAGNLVMHVAGNVRQWVVAGLGGRADTRDRAGEFNERGGASVREVLGHLEAAVTDADAVLEALDSASLLEPRSIQGLLVTGMEALYHVVEHFSMHTGQILYLVKLRTGRDLGFYDVDEAGRVRGTRW
jgi:uncharacterized damage-inducible protein DinB